MLDIITQLKDKRSIELTLIGQGSQKSELEKLVRERKLPIRFIDKIPYEKMSECHRESDCFISTSFAEGHPKALIEAMSSALPCLVSNSPGNRTLVRNAQNGLILELDHVEQWVSLALDLIDHPEHRKKLGLSAREWIIKNFDINQTLRRELDFLLRIAEN